MTVEELMHRLAGLPPGAQVRLPYMGTLVAASAVHTVKLRASGVHFVACVISAVQHDVVRSTENTQKRIDAAEANRKLP